MKGEVPSAPEIPAALATTINSSSKSDYSERWLINTSVPNSQSGYPSRLMPNSGFSQSQFIPRDMPKYTNVAQERPLSHAGK